MTLTLDFTIKKPEPKIEQLPVIQDVPTVTSPVQPTAPRLCGLQHRKNFIKLMEQFRYKYDLWNVWQDFTAMTAIAISNSVDILNTKTREEQYMKIVGKYEERERLIFPQMLGELVNALSVEPGDVLGATFMELDLGSQWKGQFFTPYYLAVAMAKVTCNDMAETLKHQEFVTICEPCTGGGVMIMALAEALREMDINYQQTIHVTATDIDITCVYMSYIQFSLLGIPAVVIHGDTLSVKEWSHWYTPAHVLGFWDNKLMRRRAAEQEMVA
jgi:hypothetical protein